jgi:hypothetical protein
MSASGKSSVFSGTDLQFLLTFAAGMGAFWLSGHLPAMIPLAFLRQNPIANLVLALLVYALGMLVWNLIVLGRRRARKPILVSTLAVTVLALVTSLYLAFGKPPVPGGPSGVAIFVFVLYLVYGLYYVAGWAIARRLAPQA